MFFSPSTGGFYSLEFHGADGIPSDAVEISDDEYAALKGRLIEVGPGGRPRLVVDLAPLPLTVGQVQALRQSAYAAESDPLKIEAEFDAQLAGGAPDYSAWIAKVEEIKARYPLPAE